MSSPFNVTSRVPDLPLTRPVAPSAPVLPVQVDIDSTQTTQTPLQTLAEALQQESTDGAEELSLHAEEPDELEELNFFHQETESENVRVEETNEMWALLGGTQAQEDQHKLIGAILNAISEGGALYDVDLRGAAGQAAVDQAFPQLQQLSPLQRFLVVSGALASAKKNGMAPAQVTQLEVMLSELLRNASPELLRSLRALASYRQAGIDAPDDGLDLDPGINALELARSLRGDGVTLIQKLDLLQQQIGVRLHRAIRAAAAKKQENMTRLLETMRVAQLVVLIRTAQDAARDLIAACDHYQTPLRVPSEVLAEQILEMLQEAPGKKPLQALAQHWLQPAGAKYGLFFAELRQILKQRFSLTAWRSLADRAQLLNLLEQLSGLPEPLAPSDPAGAAASKA